MRFEDGRIDQFVSDKKSISTAERDELFTQYRRRGRDYIPVAVQQVKNSYSGLDTGFPAKALTVLISLNSLSVQMKSVKVSSNLLPMV